VCRIISGRGGGGVVERLLILSLKMALTVLEQLSVRLLSLAHESICSSSMVRV